MKQFLDFLPLVVFFAFYKIYDIYAATAALIVATAIVLIYSWVRFRKVEKMALITFVLVVVFGGLTLFFHNDEFIKWKVTVIYALFAGVEAESGLGCFLYPLRSGKHLHRILAAAKYLGQL